ncbi:hypothetical protein DUNSADRAFT_10886 [Dunaliella salina]|uniref:Secreted protein n=1 Tax=Dunaliella salina TaxID=3046 RepID=A0ABQ7H4N8_DUNSA|nr:hypothetical protein DUNSADRAFT_10886 [Dunaliella salina]|eukprot:KAF5841823.1 hypothetical protein DUNSADRAFT_10886 [Dunaliella salina]
MATACRFKFFFIISIGCHDGFLALDNVICVINLACLLGADALMQNLCCLSSGRGRANAKLVSLLSEFGVTWNFQPFIEFFPLKFITSFHTRRPQANLL